MLYPRDPNDPLIWSDGLGQLTIRGKLQHIRLGEYLRQRYSTLLNSTYKASEVIVLFLF
jgi:lysosomal acid phosphatase